MSNHAPAPSKAAANVTLVAGLLSIPVKFYSATEDVAVHREQYTKTGKRVGSAPCIKDDAGNYTRRIRREDIVKKFATTSGLIELTDDEIERLVVSESGRAEIVSTHPHSLYEAGEYLPNGKVWQVRAETIGIRPLELLLQALREEDVFAVVQWCKGGTPYTGALFPNGQLFGIRYDEEVREELPRPSVEFSSDELQLARQLVSLYRQEDAQTLTHPAEAVRAYAESKAAGRVVVVQKAPVQSQATDLLAALRSSVNDARKAREGVSA